MIVTQPFVIAKLLLPNPDTKTIIFYNHYDTVPADGDQPWTGGPFTLSVHYGTMYGRGVDDDRDISQLVSQLFENTFVKVAICQSISPLSSKGRGVRID